MFTVISIFFGGIILGYVFKNISVLQKLGKPIFTTVLILLFILGISIGANEEIVRNFASLGSQALILALAGTLGSVCLAKLVYHFFFEKGGKI